MDADILVTLAPKHQFTADFVQQLRLKLPSEFPGVTFYFLPSDMVGQILNFGLPAPIDIQVVGNNLEANRLWAETVLNKIKYVPGTADLRIQQPFNEPYLHFNIERTKAQQLGLTRAEHRTRSADLTRRQLPDFTNLLGRSDEPHQLRHHDYDTPVPDGQVTGTRGYASHFNELDGCPLTHGQPDVDATRNGNGSCFPLQHCTRD